jgi:excisionase family DNA binding protein
MEKAERLLYRMQEAAEALGISRAKAYELANRGVIPTVRLDEGSIRVPVAGLRDLIARRLAESQQGSGEAA